APARRCIARWRPVLPGPPLRGLARPPAGVGLSPESTIPMCGIAGLWAPELEGHERASLVHAMLERLGHRGPDGVAVADTAGLALGITRLAIVAPHLPPRVFADPDGVRAVVNGELYNHRALIAELRGRGHEVPDGPDTAVVPHLYAEHGPGFPRTLDG